jgi:hypothetical protein
MISQPGLYQPHKITFLAGRLSSKNMPSFLIGVRFAQTVNNLIFRIVDLSLRSSYEHRVKRMGGVRLPFFLKVICEMNQFLIHRPLKAQ